MLVIAVVGNVLLARMLSHTELLAALLGSTVAAVFWLRAMLRRLYRHRQAASVRQDLS
jgi:hypothetical protein